MLPLTSGSPTVSDPPASRPGPPSKDEQLAWPAVTKDCPYLKSLRSQHLVETPASPPSFDPFRNSFHAPQRPQKHDRTLAPVARPRPLLPLASKPTVGFNRTQTAASTEREIPPRLPLEPSDLRGPRVAPLRPLTPRRNHPPPAPCPTTAGIGPQSIQNDTLSISGPSGPSTVQLQLASKRTADDVNLGTPSNRAISAPATRPLRPAPQIPPTDSNSGRGNVPLAISPSSCFWKPTLKGRVSTIQKRAQRGVSASTRPLKPAPSKPIVTTTNTSVSQQTHLPGDPASHATVVGFCVPGNTITRRVTPRASSRPNQTVYSLRPLRPNVPVPSPPDSFVDIRDPITATIPEHPLVNPSPPVATSPGRTPSPPPLAPAPKRQRLADATRIGEVINRALAFLCDEYEGRAAASDIFPPEISPTHIRRSVARCKDHLAAAAQGDLCASCGMIVPIADLSRIESNDPILQPLANSLDNCGLHGNHWSLCSSCHSALIRNTMPKFSAKNLVNVTLCQHYPSVLEDLTPVEECVIARSHPLGVILKLRPGGHSSPINYRALRGHFIVIPQDPGPLLDILPSPQLRLHNMIKVFWLGKRRPVDTDLSPFLLVRKAKVLAALKYLLRHNHLYRDVTINHAMMDDWSDDFIPMELRDSIISLDESDHHEREGYTVNLQPGNFENDLQAAQDEAGFENEDGGPLITGSVSTDINGERQDPDMRTLDTLFNAISNRSPPPSNHTWTRNSIQLTDRINPQRSPVISYSVRGRTTLVDCWTDPSYFTAAFPTLFPTGAGGHLEERDIPMSLDAFAEWALRHHSRRFARHKTFMYLLYDVIQLRKSSLGNLFLIKRQNWRSAADDIASLTLSQLQNAVKAVAAGQKIDDPVIRRLQRNIVTIGMRVPGSFAQKLMMRSEIRGIIVRYGMPAFWITINPSDLRNPLVLILAGVEYSGDIFSTANAAIREAVATSNPVAVAEFFHHVCKAVLDGLLSSNNEELGILGDVSNHFGVVETNGRGMLHLHALVWVRGNLAFASLRNRLQNDIEYAARMIHYLETIIVQSIDPTIPDDPEVNLPTMPPSAQEAESDEAFVVRLADDSNAVAQKKQLHSRHHLSTCFKYQRRNSAKNSCRFGMPRELVPTSKVDEFGIIHLARNHPWVNPWNPALASCLRSNHDISWIPTVSKSLSLIYYITNYATKDDVSPWQVIAKAALLKQSIERAKEAHPPTATELRLQEKGMNNFVLRCFNTLAHDREISGVQVASTLLQLPSYYTKHYNFVRVNLWWLRQHVRAMLRSEGRDETSAPMADEPCTYEVGDTAPASVFDNYKRRDPHLASLSFFEYCMLVRTKNVRDAILDDVDFDPRHPRYNSHVQRLARSESQVATISFTGQLTEFQAEEDAVPGGHPNTEAIINDLAEILLGLFIPWQDLSLLLHWSAEQGNNYSQIWATVEPTLAPHNRDIARNIELLRKSKEDCHADAKLRESATAGAAYDSYDHDIDEAQPADFYSDDEQGIEHVHLQDENFNAETLLAAYHSISRIWQKETLMTGRRIPPLVQGTIQTKNTMLQNLRPINILHDLADDVSGLLFLSPSTLQGWELRLKDFSNTNDEDVAARSGLHGDFELDDFNIEMDDGILQPMLTTVDMSLFDDRRSRVGDTPTGNSLTSLVVDEISLNFKQRMVVEKVLSEALSWAEHPFDSSQRTQMLLCIMGEGGTGKSQVIKAIVAGMDLLHRKHEVILMAPTGAAADNIGGNTYHTSLGISIDRSRAASTTRSRIKRLWARKTIMFVDEVSMVDLTMISLINNHCKIAKSLDRSSPEFFGGLPVVIFIGDFFQFSPVRGPALWKVPRFNRDEDKNGQLLWHQFTQVIILDEQMRQAEDPPFRELLARARSGSLTGNDLSFLNSKAITSLVAPQLEGATAVVKRNSVRHLVNRIQMENFARMRNQRIYIFPALHTRTRSTGPGNLRLRADDLLLHPDQGTKIPFPGLFLYTASMPAVILTNICTLLGQVNGAAGTAVGIVVDPSAEFFEIDDLYIMCTKPPACVLFKQDKPKSTTFEGLEPSVMPVFPVERSITLKGYSVRRRQVPMCPAFCLTDYKVQGSTLTSAILDLKDDPTIRGLDRHRKYCSTYVQLSRLQSSNGLHLLQKLDWQDLQFGPDPQLLTEMQRLQELEKETIAAWEGDR